MLLSVCLECFDVICKFIINKTIQIKMVISSESQFHQPPQDNSWNAQIPQTGN